MKTVADLQAYCESRFPVGEPTTWALSVTGEEYVVIGEEEGPADDLWLPGIVKEGKKQSLGFSPEDALWSALACFAAYAEDKNGVLYWRWAPELELDLASNRWRVYMRCLISDKPARPEFRDSSVKKTELPEPVQHPWGGAF